MDEAARKAAWVASGGQGDVPAGWYGNGGSAQNPNYGGASGGVGMNVAPVDPSKIAGNYMGYYNTAANTIGSQLNPITDKLTGYADSAETIAGKKAQATLDLAPVYQDIYKNYAQQLQNEYNDSVTAIDNTKDSEVGRAKATAAKMGFDTTSGYEGDQQRIIKNTYDAQTIKVAKEYGLKFEQLKNEETKDLKQLTIDAYTALSEGNTQAATIIGQVAGIKVQQQQLATSAANAMQSAQDNAEARAIETAYNNASLYLKNIELNLQAKKIQLDDANTKSQIGLSEKELALKEKQVNAELSKGTKAAVYGDSDAARLAGLVGLPITPENNTRLSQAQAQLTNASNSPTPSTTNGLVYDPNTGLPSVSTTQTNWFSSWNPLDWNKITYTPVAGGNTVAPVTGGNKFTNGTVTNDPLGIR